MNPYPSVYNEFTTNIHSIKDLSAIYTDLTKIVKFHPEDISDLLRVQVINIVSAMDRYIHEIVRKGIVEMFMSTRKRTEKFNSFALTAKDAIQIWNASNLDDYNKNAIIDSFVMGKLSYLSFETPEKILDALSYIWDEPHKMMVIANKMGIEGTNSNEKGKQLKSSLSLYVDRRNQIAHESDIDISTGLRRDISKSTVDGMINFISNFVSAINKCI